MKCCIRIAYSITIIVYIVWSFNNLRGPIIQGMQFYPGARNTGTIKEFTPRNHNATPSSAEFLPNVRNMADFKQGGPGPTQNDLIAKIPEFVPRSHAPPGGNGIMNDNGGMRGTNNSASLMTHNSGGMHDQYNSGKIKYCFFPS